MLCVAAGFLTKWTAPAFFYLAIVPLLLWRRRLSWLFGRDHLLGVAVAVAVCTAWVLVVAHEVGWSVLRDTVLQEARQRFAPKARGKPYPWLESFAFPALVIGAILPWSIPALLSLRSRFLRALEAPERRLVQLLHCWAWPNLLFWSLPSQHNVRYVLPLCPAIALLGILFLLHWSRSIPCISRRFPIILATILISWAAVKIVHVELIAPDRTANRNARATGERLSAIVPEGEILYLCRLKDEGVLFYYGRPALRLDSLERPPEKAAFAVLLDAEWSGLRLRADYITELRDQQQAPIHLVRLHGAKEGESEWPASRLPIPPRSSPSAP
jgi:hypothetical protein